MSRGYVICMPHMCRASMGVLVCLMDSWCGVVIHIGVGLWRCSFRQTGQFSGPQNVERATVQGFTLFLCLEKTNVSLRYS